MMKFWTTRNWLVLTKYCELYRNGFLIRKSFEKRKLRKFRRLVSYLNKKSPYYREIVKARHIDIENCTPSDFPVMNRKTLMENYDRIVTDRSITKRGVEEFVLTSKNYEDLYLGKYHAIRSSGSSGNLGYFLFSRRDWLHGLSQGFRLEHATLFGRRHFAFFGAVGNHRFGGVNIVTDGIYSAFNKRHDIRTFEINDPIDSVVNQLNAFQPEVLGGYKAGMRKLAEKQVEGALHISPIAIETFGEAVTEADKAYLQSAFKCGVFNLYGCCEHLLMGVGHPGQSSITLYDDDLIYDIHEDHTLVTNLFNYTLPLINYYMYDRLQLRPTSEFSPYREIETLIGRGDSSAEFINRHGKTDQINSMMLDHYQAGIRQFQLQPTSEATFDFVICFETGLTTQEKASVADKARRWLESILKRKAMDNLKFIVKVVDDIPVNPRTRKLQLIADLAEHEQPLLKAVGS